MGNIMRPLQKLWSESKTLALLIAGHQVRPSIREPMETIEDQSESDTSTLSTPSTTSLLTLSPSYRPSCGAKLRTASPQTFAPKSSVRTKSVWPATKDAMETPSSRSLPWSTQSVDSIFTDCEYGIHRLSLTSVMQKTRSFSQMFHVGDADWLRRVVAGDLHPKRVKLLDGERQSVDVTSAFDNSRRSGAAYAPMSEMLESYTEGLLAVSDRKITVTPRRRRRIDEDSLLRKYPCPFILSESRKLQDAVIRGLDGSACARTLTLPVFDVRCPGRLRVLRVTTNASVCLSSTLYCGIDAAKFHTLLVPARLLGTGGYGVVYASSLENVSIAVKVIGEDQDFWMQDGRNVKLSWTHCRKPLTSLNRVVAEREASYGRITNALIALGATCAFPMLHRAIRVKRQILRTDTGTARTRYVAAAYLYDQADCTVEHLVKGGSTFSPLDLLSITAQCMFGVCTLASVGVSHNDLYQRNVLLKRVDASHLLRYRLYTCRSTDPGHVHSQDCYSIRAIQTDLGKHNYVAWISDFGLATGGGLDPFPVGLQTRRGSHSLHQEFSPPDLPRHVAERMKEAEEQAAGTTSKRLLSLRHRSRADKTYEATMRSLAISACEDSDLPVHVALSKHVPVWARDLYVLLLMGKRTTEKCDSTNATQLEWECIRWFRRVYADICLDIRHGELASPSDVLAFVSNVMSAKYLKQIDCRRLTTLFGPRGRSGCKVTDFDVASSQRNKQAVESVTMAAFS